MAGPPAAISSPWSPLKMEDADEDGTAENNAVPNVQAPNVVTAIPSLLSFLKKYLLIYFGCEIFDLS